MQEISIFPQRPAPTPDRQGSGRDPDRGDFAPAGAWHGNLGRIIEAEIIPRLMLAHRGPRQEATAAETTRRPPDEGAFARILIESDMAEALSYIRRLRRQGVPTDGDVLDFLASTARRLGRLWEADHCDFVDVTIGLRRLQNLMQELTPEFGAPAGAPRSPRVLILPAPGETHLFGAAMVARSFGAAGWCVLEAEPSGHLPFLRSNWVDAIGYSLSCDRYLERLGPAIRDARSTSKNASLVVLVGGRVIAANPDLVGLVGADATAADAPAAVDAAQQLLELRVHV